MSGVAPSRIAKNLVTPCSLQVKNVKSSSGYLIREGGSDVEYDLYDGQQGTFGITYRREMVVRR